MAKRREIIESLKGEFFPLFSTISGYAEQPEISYFSSISSGKDSKSSCKNVFYEMLCEARQRDREAGFSSPGPHRDDLKIQLDGRDARKYASQGQCRTLALSLKIASGIAVEKQAGERCLFLLDDTVSDLDAERTDNFFPLLVNRGSQFFIAAPSGKISFSTAYHYHDL